MGGSKEKKAKDITRQSMNCSKDRSDKYSNAING